MYITLTFVVLEVIFAIMPKLCKPLYITVDELRVGNGE